MRIHGVAGAVLGILLVATLAVAEQVEIVTYYPSPAATTDDLRVKRRVTVGPTYRDLKLDDSLAPIGDGTLLVEQSIGLGAPVPFKTAPDPSGKSPKNGLLGNLDVNDIWLRSVNAWASEAVAGGVEPKKPYAVIISVPPGPTSIAYQASLFAPANMGYDVYDALRLWQFGVSRNQVQIQDIKLVVMRQWLGPPEVTLVDAGVNAVSTGGDWTIAMSDGVVYVQRPNSATNNTPDPGRVFRITVTWRAV